MQLAHLEFEYWAENNVPFSSLMYYLIGSFLVFGCILCACLNACYRQGAEEELVLVKAHLWKLRGKSREYVQANAPDVLVFV